MSPEHFRILSRNPGLTYDEYFNFHPQEIIMKQPLREVPVSIKNIWTDKHQFANVHKLISCIFNVMTLSFPEPTRLLVSTKTGSSGIIKFLNFEFDSAHVKYDVYTGPASIFRLLLAVLSDWAVQPFDYQRRIPVYADWEVVHFVPLVTSQFKCNRTVELG